jgi:hypothetical protein
MPLVPNLIERVLLRTNRFPAVLQYSVTLGSRVDSSTEIGGWLAAAGFAAPRTVALRRTPGQYLLVAARS